MKVMHMEKDKLIRVCEQVATDAANDARDFDGKLFNGKTVATYYGFHGAAIKALADVLKSLLNSTPNLEVSDTTKADSSNESGNKKDEQWKEDLEKEFPMPEDLPSPENRKMVWVINEKRDAASWAKSYLETNVIEPLIKERDKWEKVANANQESFIPYPKGEYEYQDAEMDKLGITNDCFFQQRINTVIFQLKRERQEVDRLKKIIEQK